MNYSIIRNIIYSNHCRMQNLLYNEFWVSWWRENKRENYKILFFILFPFSLKYEFQNYLDIIFYIMRNILYRNICRRHFHYIWGFEIRDEERTREKTINIIFIYFIPFLSWISISKLHGYEIFHYQTHINIPLYIQNPFN
jgi:hypothetical protein